MQLLIFILVVLFSYLVGSIPFGRLFVKMKTGQDIRQVQSGRTGGTNAARAAGRLVGFTTATVDLLKASVCVWIARAILPENPWMHIAAPLAVILGHNYSIFLLERGPQGRLRLRGGAGGASCVGGSLGLWTPSMLIIIPLAGVVFYFIGYASVATMSVGLLSFLVFAVRAALGLSPWQYALYGLFAEVLLLWSLRPNIQALLQGTERLVGYRARGKKTMAEGATDGR